MVSANDKIEALLNDVRKVLAALPADTDVKSFSDWSSIHARAVELTFGEGSILIHLTLRGCRTESTALNAPAPAPAKEDALDHLEAEGA